MKDNIEDLPYWVRISWDQLHSLEPHDRKVDGWDRDIGNIVLGPFVVEQIETTGNQKKDWLPGIHNNLAIIDDRESNTHSIRFDSSFKDHLGIVDGNVRWEKDRIVAVTDEFGTISFRRLRESDRKLFRSNKPPVNSSVVQMAKFFYGEE